MVLMLKCRKMFVGIKVLTKILHVLTSMVNAEVKSTIQTRCS